MSKPTILVVDQEKMLVDLLINALSSDYLSVLGTTSALEATRLLHLHAPDLLVIDSGVPQGIQLLESIRSGVWNTKVVAVTNSYEIREQVRALGFEAIVDRNSGLDGLLNAIRGLLGAAVPLKGGEKSVHVLITEDEEALRDILFQFLSGKGYTLTLAKNGREAIQQVKSDPAIQVVLLDVSMPQMGGVEALKVIMASDPHPEVIMMTAVADREIATQTLKAGAFDYILKPFSFPDIESRITACLSHAAYKKSKSWWQR